MATLQFTRCDTCGAIIAIQGITADIDNRELHQQWHASQHPTDADLTTWIRIHEPEFKRWLAKQARINGAHPIARATLGDGG